MPSEKTIRNGNYIRFEIAHYQMGHPRQDSKQLLPCGISNSNSQLVVHTPNKINLREQRHISIIFFKNRGKMLFGKIYNQLIILGEESSIHQNFTLMKLFLLVWSELDIFNFLKWTYEDHYCKLVWVMRTERECTIH